MSHKRCHPIQVLTGAQAELKFNQVISNAGFESPCSTKGENYRSSPLEAPSASCPPQGAGFTLNVLEKVKHVAVKDLRILSGCHDQIVEVLPFDLGDCPRATLLKFVSVASR